MYKSIFYCATGYLGNKVGTGVIGHRAKMELQGIGTHRRGMREVGTMRGVRRALAEVLKAREGVGS